MDISIRSKSKEITLKKSTSSSMKVKVLPVELLTKGDNKQTIF